MLVAGRAFLARSLLTAVGGEALDGAQARAAAAWQACELSRAAKGYSWARQAQRSCSSLALTLRPSIHKRRALLRMNCVVRIASSMARAQARVRRSLYSYTSRRRLRWSPMVSHGLEMWSLLSPATDGWID